jgi:phenylalanyl-tRNA synthetase beta chain
VKVSIHWLKSLLPGLAGDADDIARRLTAAGLEVEGVHRLADTLDGVVVARVRRVEPHPKADKLRLATVFDGEAEQTVVCGAPNVAEGQKVALARLGTTLPNGMTMAPRKIRGVKSEGMLCAEDELGLSEDHEGILVLDPASKEGLPLAEALGHTDVILELGVTPNRPDALSHLGVARELAALSGLPAPSVEPRVEETGAPAAELARVSVDDEAGCGRYAARVLSGVKVGPSPRWVQDRLRALGQRPISNVVDATNFALLELGHPLHGFDLERLEGREIRVRSARAGETIALLDGSEKTLDAPDLVIADASGPVALAGVMGGASSEVAEGTSTILLESAWFAPSRVRRASKRHALHTEASHRFERGADPEAVERALDRCAELIVAWAGGQVHPGRVQVGSAPERRAVPIRAERASRLLGRTVPETEIDEALGRLGLEAVAPVGPRPAGARWFRPPSWRVDLTVEADLIEEVGRLGGYDAIPASLPPAGGEPWRGPPDEDAEALARARLVGEGFLETISLAFASPGRAAPFLGEARPVRIANPLGEESRLMRPSLLPALLDAVRHNQAQLPSLTDLRLFEVGRTFAWGADAELPEETTRVAGVLRGRRAPRGWSTPDDRVDAYDLKGAVEALLDAFRVRGRFAAEDEAHLHPRSATAVYVESTRLGTLGELHPDLAARLDLDGPPVFVFEIDLDGLHQRRGREPEHRPLPKLPPAQRDLSFFVAREVEAESALEVVRAAAPPELESVRVFDVYEGQGVPEGSKSLALELTFRAADRTLEESEISAAQASIVKALETRLGARLRDR